jgi:radical SAM enzyme (TIGR01210 family)
MNNLADLISDLHHRRLRYQKSFDTRRYISAWLEDEVLPESSSEIAKSLVVILRTNGCLWARNKLLKKPSSEKTLDTQKSQIYKKNHRISNASSIPVGGCTMCGYINDCTAETKNVQTSDLIHQFTSALERFKDKEFTMVKIFTSGSFFDNDEVPVEARMNIVGLLNKKNIEHLIIESRPEFINSKILNEMSSSFNGRLQIAIGLESCNNNILTHSINKGFLFEDYSAAAELCKDHRLLAKIYLLLKPPFISERDAIFDVVKSIEILVENEITDVISINPVNIQKFTVVEYLFKHNDYRPPWLWSVVKVLELGFRIISDKRTNKIIRLLSSPTGGGTSRGAHNCYNCDKLVMDRIHKFSMNNDPKVFYDLECNCKEKWSDILKLENMMKSRINI